MSNLDGIDTVVRSTAINDEHLEVVEARRRGIRVYHRSEALAAAMTGRRSIVVTGTHGKTTTTAIISQMLAHAGLDPSYVNGGENIGAHTGAHGNGEYFVAEADESDRSFLRFRPEIGIVTNIDVDHLNTYGDMDSLTEAFERFCRNTDKDGLLVLCADNPGTLALAKMLRGEGRTVATYGFSDGADIQLGEVGIGQGRRRLHRARPQPAARPLPPADARQAHRAQLGRRHRRGPVRRPRAGGRRRGHRRFRRRQAPLREARGDRRRTRSSTSTPTTRPR